MEMSSLIHFWEHRLRKWVKFFLLLLIVTFWTGFEEGVKALFEGIGKNLASPKKSLPTNDLFQAREFSVNNSLQNDNIAITKNLAQVEILQPRDGEKIIKFPSDPQIIKRKIKGRVLGLLNYNNLLVEVIIRTSEDFPQGTTRIKSNGSWEMLGHFGGNFHGIEAKLKHKNGKLLAKSRIITVQLIQ